MRGFIIAVTLLAFIVGGVIINSVAVDKIFTNIADLLSDLPVDSATITAGSAAQTMHYNDQLRKICKQWNNKKKIIAISTPHDEADKFTAPIVEAAAYFKEEDYPSYLARLANAKQALHHLADAERLNLDNIF